MDFTCTEGSAITVEYYLVKLNCSLITVGDPDRVMRFLEPGQNFQN